MWYSACNFGYANPQLNAALKRQIDTLPQLASQYVHKGKVDLAKAIAQRVERTWNMKGRVHFNVGGSQSIEDALKLVRNACDGKSLMFAFEGGYHGRTLGASAISSSYRYRRRYGHFGERAQFVPFPYCFRCPYGKKREDCGLYCVDQVRQAVRQRVLRRVGWQSRCGRICRLFCRSNSGHGWLRQFRRRATLKSSSKYWRRARSCWSTTRFKWASTAPESFGRWKTSA